MAELISRGQPVKSPVRLSDATLKDLPANIRRPDYDRRSLTPGIVHIGLGNFHRAHQGWYLHRLMQSGRAMDWAVLGAGVRPADVAMRGKLQAQDYLTTLIELAPTGISAEVSGSMIDYVPIEPANRPLVEAMTRPSVRIVSLTVTEGGYFSDQTSGGLDIGHPDIVHDAAHPDRPRTAFGAIVAALRARRDAGYGPFSAQSCDNLVGNGDVLRRTVLSLARLSDPTLADWIEANASFPNSMVDCIVPATGEAERSLARAEGVEDAAPVTHENFRQWVIEDDFCAGRPDWDRVGATFSNRVHDFEVMKIRVLNAGHQILANVGEIVGCRTIAACMEDSSISAFFHKVQTDEIIPHVGAVPGMSPSEYLEVIRHRFSNPSIGDTTRRVAFDGSARHVGFLLPTIKDAIAAGASIEGLALVEALWARMCFGYREDGSLIEPNDPVWNDLVRSAEAAKEHPGAWFDQRQFYGDLSKNDRFRNAFSHWLARLWKDGARATLGEYTRSAPASRRRSQGE